MQFLWSLELAINVALQSLGSWLAGPMKAFSYLGQEEFFMVIMPALFWCVDAGVGLRVGLMLLLGDSLNGCMKILFHSPRPYWYSTEVRALSTETSFGMPSGHAQNAAGIWGILAAMVRRRWLWVVVITAVFGIGLSRIYLGMHFTSDVLAGWAIGAGLVVLFLRLDQPVSAWLQERSTSQLILLGAVVSLSLIGLRRLAEAAVGEVTIPAVWVRNANWATPLTPIDPLAITGAITTAGILLGVAWGATWLWRRGGYDAAGTGWQQFVRIIIGMLGVGLFYIGLGKIFPRTDDLLGYSLRYLRYTLVGLWVAGAAPLLFIRLGLARSRREETAQSAPAQEREFEA